MQKDTYRVLIMLVLQLIYALEKYIYTHTHTHKHRRSIYICIYIYIYEKYI